jgi:hypothetical protein
VSGDRPKRDTMSIEEATVSNMWEIAAIVEEREPKSIFTKQDQLAFSSHQNRSLS